MDRLLCSVMTCHACMYLSEARKQGSQYQPAIVMHPSYDWILPSHVSSTCVKCPDGRLNTRPDPVDFFQHVRSMACSRFTLMSMSVLWSAHLSTGQPQLGMVFLDTHCCRWPYAWHGGSVTYVQQHEVDLLVSLQHAYPVLPVTLVISRQCSMMPACNQSNVAYALIQRYI